MKRISKAAMIILFCFFISPIQAYGESLQKILNVQEKNTILIDNKKETNHDFISSLKEQNDNIKKELSQAYQKVQNAKKIVEEGRKEARIRAQGEKIAEVSSKVQSPGAGKCAKYVSLCYQAAGFDYLWCNADDLYYKYCKYSDIEQAESGMIIAVATHPHTSAGKKYGHCGIIIEQDGQLYVRHNVGTIETTPLSEWIDYYGVDCQPKWGWGF